MADLTIDVEDSIACWADLLGYGSQLEKCKYKFNSKKGKEAITRIRTFHLNIVEATFFNKHIKILLLNDGVLISANAEQIDEFLLATTKYLMNALIDEFKEGNPGFRAFITIGERVITITSGIQEKPTRSFSDSSERKDPNPYIYEWEPLEFAMASGGRAYTPEFAQNDTAS